MIRFIPDFDITEFSAVVPGGRADKSAPQSIIGTRFSGKFHRKRLPVFCRRPFRQIAIDRLKFNTLFFKNP